MLILLLPAQAMELPQDELLSAPLTRSTAVQDGMVRVYLSSMGSPTSLSVTVRGSYSVSGSVSMQLYEGDVVGIGFNTSTGQITMTVDGVTYAMGQEMALRRQQASGESALQIAQSKRPSNLYPGDLQLIARASGSSYKLYPIVHVYIEYYLYGVVPYEMSSSWPSEALKAQAVAARNYTLNRMNARTSALYDVVDTASDQVYYGHSGSVTNATQAVDATRGIVIMNDGKLSGTYYTASNGGQTEAVKNAWGSSGYPYLGVKDDPFDAANPSSNKRRTTVYSSFNNAGQNSTLKSLLSAKAQSVFGSGAAVTAITSVTPHTPKYAAPSRLYTKLDFGVTVTTATGVQSGVLTFGIFEELESALGMSLNSNKNELWAVTRDGSDFVITATRYGHGIGMSQRGAQQMANMGYTYDQILAFYYEGCNRVQYTFSHTILSPVGGTVVTTEAPATIVPALGTQARVDLTGVNDVLPIRYAAADSGKVLITVPNGAAVTVLARGSVWTLVQYGVINGYVPTADLVFTGTPPASSGQSATNITEWAVVTGTSSLNLRSGAGTDHGVTGSIPGGAILPVLGTSGSWKYVQYGIQTGYCSAGYLTLYTSYPGSIASGGASAMVSLAGGTGSAPIRSEASTSAAIVMQVPHGTQVTVLSNDGSWCRVNAGGVEGYMLTADLDFAQQGTEITTPPLGADEMQAVVNSTASTLNLREGPGESYTVIAEIPKGTVIVVTAYGSDWCAVRWGSLTGYVMTKYLAFDAETDTPAPTQTGVPSGSPAITTGLADLMETASASGNVLLVLPAGETVTVLDYGETWSLVSYGSMAGYVLNSCIRLYQDMETPTPTPAPTPSATPSPTPTATPEPLPEETYTPMSGTAVMILSGNMKEEPDTSSGVLAVVPEGAEVTLCAVGTWWSQVTWNGVTGWVLTNSIHILSQQTPTPEPVVPEEIGDAPTAAAAGKTAWVSLNVTQINLRAAADPEGSVLAEIEQGEPLTVLNEGDTWSLAAYGGHTGYVLTQHLVYMEPAQALGIRYINTETDPLALRDQPAATGSKVLLRIARGEKVSLIAEAGEWSHVLYGQTEGYCATRYLSVDKPGKLVRPDMPLLDVTLEDAEGWTASAAPADGGSVYLYEWCALDADTVTEVPFEGEMTVQQIGSIWCKVSYEGKVGYCLKKYLRLTGPEN